MIAAHKGAKMTREIIFWAMNILGGVEGKMSERKSSGKVQAFLKGTKWSERAPVKWSCCEKAHQVCVRTEADKETMWISLSFSFLVTVHSFILCATN